MSRAARNSAKHRTFTMIFFLIPTLLFLAWWQRTGTGKFSKQLDGFKVPRQVANRLFIGLRHQWRRIFACYFVVFLEKIRVLEALAQSFFDGLYPLPGHGWGKNEWCAGQTEIAKHGQYPAFPLGFGEAVNFGQIVKARMFGFARNRIEDMEINQSLLQPVRFTNGERFVGGRHRIDFAAQESYVSLRCRKTSDVPSFFEPDEPGHDPADIVDGMADRLSAQAQARGLPELVEGAKSGLAPRQK